MELASVARSRGLGEREGESFQGSRTGWGDVSHR